MTSTLSIPKEIVYYQHTGIFRVCETNDIYECGWIFVSNELTIDEAIEKQEKLEKERPHLIYTIVPIFKSYAN